MAEQSYETRVALLEQAVGQIGDNVREIKDATVAIAESVQSIARLEERQLSMSSGLERANEDITNIYSRVHALEVKQPESAMTNRWVNKAVDVLIVAVVAGMVSAAVGNRAASSAVAQTPAKSFAAR